MFREDTFQGKVALVTGGRSGIGYCIAKNMLQQGAKVIIISRKEEQLLNAQKELAEFGECGAVACDIKNTEEIKKVVEYIKQNYGKLDILVNNAGGQFPALAEYISDKGWSAVINNNLNGTFFMTRDMANAFFIPQKNGVVVNIIVDLYRGFPGMVHTGAARAGVENMTKSLAQEWSDFNIRLNCVAPGIIESSGLGTYPKPVQDRLDEAKQAIPLKRFGEAQDIANAVCFLSSSLSSYITGTTLYVDGAQHLNFDKMGLPNTLKSFM
jgi:NAD(P)-dependent dehydrogenase (short-subunit alcohol dehydrogenase family)